MVRARGLILAVLLVGLSISTAAAETDLRSTDFQKLFDKQVDVSATEPAHLDLYKCEPGDRFFCSYHLDAAVVQVVGVAKSDKLDGVTVICGDGCGDGDLFVAIKTSLQVMVPGLSSDRYEQWVKDGKYAFRAGQRFKTQLGPVHLSIAPLAGTRVGILYFSAI